MTLFIHLCVCVSIVDIDECLSGHCQNGATCKDGVNSYTCNCAAGYTGQNCSIGQFNEGYKYEPPHDKAKKWHVRPAKTQISLGIRPVWSESSLCARRKLGSSSTHWAHIEDSDQTGRTPRLVWVFAGRKVSLLVLSWGGSYIQPNLR